MRTNCGLWRLPQENESSPVAVYPISAPRQSKFRDRNSETQRYLPDRPMQSYLENRPLTTSIPHSPPTHNHCKISAYGSCANPTSNHRASSQYVSPWRSVARWQTNGAALKWILNHGNPAEQQAAMIQLHELTHPPGQLNEKGLINPHLAPDFEHVYDNVSMNGLFSATAYLSKMEQEYGQIAFILRRPGRDAEPFPVSKIASSSSDISHSHDISANPSRSPLSSSDSLPPPPPMFPRPSNISENPEWSPLWLVQPPLREMVPLPTYQMPVVPANSGANVDDAKAINDPESAFGANVTALQFVHDPNDDANDMPLVPVSRQELPPSQEFTESIVPPLILESLSSRPPVRLPAI